MTRRDKSSYGHSGIDCNFSFHKGVKTFTFLIYTPLSEHNRSVIHPVFFLRGCTKKDVNGRSKRHRRVESSTIHTENGFLQQPSKEESRPDVVSMSPTPLGSIGNRSVRFWRGRADNRGSSRPPLANRRCGLGADLEKY